MADASPLIGVRMKANLPPASPITNGCAGSAVLFNFSAFAADAFR